MAGVTGHVVYLGDRVERVLLRDKGDGAGACGGVSGIAGAAWAGFNGLVKVDEGRGEEVVGEGRVASVSDGVHEHVVMVEREGVGATGGTEEGVGADLDEVEGGVDGNEENETGGVITRNFANVTLLAGKGGGGGDAVCDAEAYGDGSVGEGGEDEGAVSFVHGEGIGVGIGGVVGFYGEVEEGDGFVGGGEGEHVEGVSVGLEDEVPDPVMVEDGEQMGEVWQRLRDGVDGGVHGGWGSTQGRGGEEETTVGEVRGRRGGGGKGRRAESMRRLNYIIQKRIQQCAGAELGCFRMARVIGAFGAVSHGGNHQ